MGFEGSSKVRKSNGFIGSRVALVIAYVSKERIASILRMTRIGEPGIKLKIYKSRTA
jgi:hypothetical protein